MDQLQFAEQLIDVNYKDNSPMNTVNKIKDILRQYGVEVEEIWRETNVPYCYAITIKEKSTGFSVNGKGLTRELTLASGYGEFMERLQLGFVGKRAVQKDGAYAIQDEVPLTMTAEALLAKNRDYYEKMARRLQEWNGSVITPDEIVTQYADAEGNVTVTPFVNLITGETEYLPGEMRKTMYTSNGCAAGNSMEEALVQAMGEIVERYYRLQIVAHKICTPEVPEEVLRQYKVAYRIIEYIRQQGYKVVVKDCSLGTKFPVVCVCYVNQNKGTYHTHFGAYPIFEIALTRALTETFQGREISSFAEHSDMFLGANDKDFVLNLTQELTFGSSARMPEFFTGAQNYPYNGNVGFAGKNNKELLKECITFFKDMGYAVLARNASGLGFPTCQVIIPGYSETYIHRVSKKTDENRYLPFAVKTFRNPAQVTVTEMMGTLKHLNEAQTFYGHYQGRTSFLAGAKLMADLDIKEDQFLLLASLAHIYYTVGNTANAAKNVKQMLKLNVSRDEEYLRCLDRYMSMMQHKYDPDMIRQVLEFLHNKETVQRLYDYVESGKNLLEPFVLHCDMRCDDSCPIKDKCCQMAAQRLIGIVNSATQTLNFDEFTASVKALID